MHHMASAHITQGLVRPIPRIRILDGGVRESTSAQIEEQSRELKLLPGMLPVGIPTGCSQIKG